MLEARQLQYQRSNPQSEAISSILREVVLKEGIPGIIAAITSSERIVSIGSEGLRRIKTKEKISNNDLIHIGSCTKAMKSRQAFFNLLDQINFHSPRPGRLANASPSFPLQR